MCSRKRKYRRKLQAFLCLVASITLVSSDEVRDFYTLQDHLKVGLDDLRNATLSYADVASFEGDSSSPESTSERLGGHLRPVVGDVRTSSSSSSCPPSCFCEDDAGYTICVGDGQWAPPSLPIGFTRVELRGYFLPELGPSQLQALPGILELQLHHCNLSRLLDNAFASMPELDSLDMSENHLSMLGPSSLMGLKSLRRLDLSSNHLTVLKRPFTQLSSLQHLNLHHNLLHSLVQDTFQGLGRVQYIDLDSNEISFLEVSAFQHLTSLAHLILSNNRLSTLATLDFFGSRLQYIDVSNIGIARVPQALTQFVRDLRIARNEISEIHRGDLDSYPYLTLLVLDNNNLRILEEDALGRHEYLARLWLNGNCLESIPLSLPPSLQALYLEENSIAALQDGDFRGLVNLQQLSLQHNNISVIAPCAFCELTSLKTLNLQGNLITSLSGKIFFHLANLEGLDLSQNPIRALDAEAYMGLTSLKTLRMSHIESGSPTVEVPGTLFESLRGLWDLDLCESPEFVAEIVNSTEILRTLRALRELNIMHNGLTELRRDFPKFFPKLQTVKLSGNSWDCSSPGKIMWMQKWMERASINFYRSLSVRCVTPLTVTFKPVILLEDTDFATSETFQNDSDVMPSTFSTLTVVDTTTEPVPVDPVTEDDVTVGERSIDEGELVSYLTTEPTTYPGTVIPETRLEIMDNTTSDESELTSVNDIIYTSLFSLPLMVRNETMSTQESVPSALEITPVWNESVTDAGDEASVDVQTETVPPVTTESFTSLPPSTANPTSTTTSPVEITTSSVETTTPPVETTTSSVETTTSHTETTLLTTTATPTDTSDEVPLPTTMFHHFRREYIHSSVKSTEPSRLIRITAFTNKFARNQANKQSIQLKSSTHSVEEKELTATVESPITPSKPRGREREFHSHKKDLWLYRGDSSHGVNRLPLPLGMNPGKVSDQAVVGAGIVATCLGVALFVGGFLLAQGRAKNGGSLDLSSSSASYWRDGSGEDEVLMAAEEDTSPAESSLQIQSEGGVEVETETHTGLNSRLYLLLQRDSSTGITPDSLPDPRAYLGTH